MKETALTPAREAAPWRPRRFRDGLRLHHRAVYARPTRCCGDGGLAEDVTQEAFLRLHSNRDSVRRANAPAWLLRVA